FHSFKNRSAILVFTASIEGRENRPRVDLLEEEFVPWRILVDKRPDQVALILQTLKKRNQFSLTVFPYCKKIRQLPVDRSTRESHGSLGDICRHWFSKS